MAVSCWRRAAAIKIHRNSPGNDHGRVVAKIEIARDAINHRKCGEKDEEGEPAAIEAKASAGEPEWSHWISLNDRRVAAYPADRQTEDESRGGLPAKIQDPNSAKALECADRPWRAKAEHDRDGDAGIGRPGLQGLHDRIEQAQSQTPRPTDRQRQQNAEIHTLERRLLRPVRAARKRRVRQQPRPMLRAGWRRRWRCHPGMTMARTQTRTAPQPTAMPTPASRVQPERSVKPCAAIGLPDDQRASRRAA